MSVHSAHGADISASWLGGDGNWSDPANWSTNPNVPNNGASTYDVIISGGNVTVDIPIIVQQLDITANSSVSGIESISTQERLTVTGGEMIGPGVTNANAGFTTNALHLQQGRTLNNFGSSLVEGSIFNQGGLIILSGGSVLNNTNGSTIHFQDDASIRFSETTGQFNNDGTLLKTGTNPSSNFSVVSVDTTNSGLVDVQSGQLSLRLSGTQTGDFTVASGSSLHLVHGFTPPTYVAGSEITAVSGTSLALQGGTFESGSSITSGGDVRFENFPSTIHGAYNVAGKTTISQSNVNFINDEDLFDLELAHNGT